MKHKSRFEINPNHVEQFFMLFQPGSTIVAYKRYAFQYNEFISRGSVKHMRLFNNAVLGGTANFPSTYTFNGTPFNTMNLAYASTFLVTIADRKGGYFVEDIPLSAFLMGTAAGHYKMKLNLDIDYSKSFLVWNAPFNEMPVNGFAIIFYLDMYGKLNDE